MIENGRRDLAVEIAWAYYGTFYKWGGDDPSGLDCSGFVIEIMKSVGLMDHSWDLTADGLKDLFIADVVSEEELKPGSLVFWLNSASVATHIDMVLDVHEDGTVFLIGASGGGPGVTGTEEAIIRNAFVKIRPLHYRKGSRVYADPFQ